MWRECVKVLHMPTATKAKDVPGLHFRLGADAYTKLHDLSTQQDRPMSTIAKRMLTPVIEAEWNSTFKRAITSKKPKK